MSSLSQKGEAAGGIQSLDTALRVLQTLSQAGKALSLSELARLCGLPPTKVHRYLASFSHSGLVAQNGRSGTYDLGQGAIHLGLAALARHDFVNTTADALPGLAEETGLTVLLCVWGNSGPTVVRWQRSTSLMVTSLGLGTTLPLLTSATGRIGLSYLPEVVTRHLVESELRRIKRNPGILDDMKASLAGVREFAAAVRKQGFASVDGRFIPGLVAIAAPVLDWQGQAQAVITLIGTDPTIIEANSEAQQILAQFCRAHSIVDQH